MNDDRSNFYSGPKSWLVSAALSLFGTTSGVVSLLVGKSLELHIPNGVALTIVMALVLFYALGMWMSVIAGGSLMFRSPKDNLGSWTLRGRPVPQRAWRAVLAICYLAPWVGIAVMILILWLRA